MSPRTTVPRLVAVGVVVLAAGLPVAGAKTPADKFYEGYYLETVAQDYAAAADLYREVTSADQAAPGIQAKARARLAICREDLACQDFTRLMPPAPLAYVEMNRPGERVRKLLGQLGLLADENGGAPAADQIAIRPAVIDTLLGVRGAAVAITGFDPMTQMPSGVLVFHPGNIDLVRSAIESALPVAAEPVSPIGGFATYRVDEKVFVTLTARLVIVSTTEMQIEEVLARLAGDDTESLATNRDLDDIRPGHDDALLLFFVNPKPLMPMINAMLTAAAAQEPELATVQALLDIGSLRSFSGRFDLSDRGLLFELSLRLDKDHHNLVYNFLRGPAIDPETLRCIPPDAAFVVAGALNHAPEDYDALPPIKREGRPIVTYLDLGREIFANINGVALAALPPTEAKPRGDEPIPDIALVITVNDPKMSRVLWNQILGLGSLASGAASMRGQTHKIDGVSVQSYSFEDKVTVFFATAGHHLLVGTSESAMARSIAAMKGESVLDEPAFEEPVARLNGHTSFAAFMHPARCAEIGKLYMSAREVAEMEQFIAPMTDTVASVMVTHSDQLLRLTAAVTGIPDVGEVVAKAIARERVKNKLSRAKAAGDWKTAGRIYDRMLAERPGDPDLLRGKFDVLAIHKRDHDQALALADELLKQWSDNAHQLNSFSWALLTSDVYGKQYTDVALRLSRRCNELTEHKVAAYVDTLAEACQQNGDIEQALELRKQALDLVGSSYAGDRPDYATRYIATLHAAGRDGQAAAFAEQALGDIRDQFGNRGAEMLSVVTSWGAGLSNAGYPAYAVPLYREALEITREQQGPASPATAAAHNALGVMCSWSGDPATAADEYRVALGAYRELEGDESLNTSQARTNLAGTLAELQELDEAEELARDAVAALRKLRGDDHFNTAEALRTLGCILVEQGKLAEAEDALRNARASLSRLNLASSDRWRIGRAEGWLGRCLVEQGRFAEAEPLLLGAYQALHQSRGDAFSDTRTVLRHVVALYDAWDKPDQAAQWQTKLPLAEKSLTTRGPDS